MVRRRQWFDNLTIGAELVEAPNRSLEAADTSAGSVSTMSEVEG
jgi:hypothetical protein